MTVVGLLNYLLWAAMPTADFSNCSNVCLLRISEMAEAGLKRKDTSEDCDDDSDTCIGPLPDEASKPKKKKGLQIMRFEAKGVRIGIVSDNRRTA
jgi:hypothetical protein